MLRVAIVEEQCKYLDIIKNSINKFCRKSRIVYHIDVFNKATLLLYEIEDGLKYDIYFIDVLMPEMNGLTLAKEIRKRGELDFIIFISETKEFALESYEVNAFQYILKEYLSEKIDITLKSIQNEIYSKAKDYYIIQTKNRYEKINMGDIVYLYKEDKYVVLVTNKKNIYVRDTLKNIYSQLNKKQFEYIAKNYIVNLAYINRIEGNKILINTNINLHVTRHFIKSFKYSIRVYKKEAD